MARGGLEGGGAMGRETCLPGKISQGFDNFITPIFPGFCFIISIKHTVTEMSLFWTSHT